MKDLRLAGISTMEAANVSEAGIMAGVECPVRASGSGVPNQHRPLTGRLELATILCHGEQRVIGNDYIRRSPLSNRTQTSEGRHAPSAVARRTAAGRRVGGSVSGLLIGGSRSAACGRSQWRRTRASRRFAKITTREAEATGCRASSIAPARRSGSALLTEDKSIWKTRFFMPKPQLRDFTKPMDPRLEQSPPGAPEIVTGSASQENPRRLLRSQPRRLGFGQPRRARSRRGYANITIGARNCPQNRNFLLAGNRNFLFGSDKAYRAAETALATLEALMISTFEMARGMWNYQTLAYAVRAGSRYAAMYGKGCTANGNTSGTKINEIPTRVNSIIVLPALLPFSFTTNLLIRIHYGADQRELAGQ